MATAFTYTTLVEAIQSNTEDTGAEFLAYIPTAIAMAEDRLLRDLDLELFDVAATSTFGVASPWLAKPSDMVGLRTMHYTDGTGNFNLIEPKTWEFAKDYWPNVNTTSSTPKYYVEFSETNWFIAGTPASGLTVTIRYIKRPAGLSVGTPTTWLSQHVGDLLLLATLISSEQYLKADDRIIVWKQDYAERLLIARRELNLEQRNDYMPMTATPVKEQ